MDNNYLSAIPKVEDLKVDSPNVRLINLIHSFEINSLEELNDIKKRKIIELIDRYNISYDSVVLALNMFNIPEEFFYKNKVLIK